MAAGDVDGDGRDEIGALTTSFNTMIGGLRERERMHDIFGRFVSPTVARLVLDQPLDQLIGRDPFRLGLEVEQDPVPEHRVGEGNLGGMDAGFPDIAEAARPFLGLAAVVDPALDDLNALQRCAGRVGRAGILHGEHSEARTNHRNGYRDRDSQTRAATVEWWNCACSQ